MVGPRAMALLSSSLVMLVCIRWQMACGGFHQELVYAKVKEQHLDWMSMHNEFGLLARSLHNMRYSRQLLNPATRHREEEMRGNKKNNMQSYDRSYFC